MSLSDFRPETREIGFPGGSFNVKGLTLNDLSELVRTHLPAARALYTAFNSGMTLDEVIFAALRDSPIMVAHIIGLASGEDGGFDAAYTLPFPISVSALREIMPLTFESVGGPGNAIAAITDLIRALTPAQRQTLDHAA
jgi:hypothetical protein